MFKRILGKNLFSWAELDYEVMPGISLIDGFNYDDNTPEGSGKSSVLNALCWTLFGQIPKEVKIDEVIRKRQKSGAGQVNLDSGFCIIRTRKPNDLYIVDPSGNKIKGKDAKETQQLIIDLIGMGFETFCQTLYFSQSYPKKFITAGEADKGKILSEIQDLTIFDKARKKAVAKASEAGKEAEILQIKVDKDEERLEELEERIQDVERALRAFETAKKVRIQDLEESIVAFEERKNKKIKELKKTLKEMHDELRDSVETFTPEHAVELEEQIEHYSKMQKAITDKKAEVKFSLKQADKIQEDFEKAEIRRKKEVRNLERQIEELVEDIEELRESEDKCPVCGGPLGDEHQAKIDEKIEKKLKKLESLASEHEVLLTKEVEEPEFLDTEEAEKLLKEIVKESDKISEAYSELLQERAKIQRYEKQIQSMESKISDLSEELKEVESEEPTSEIKKLEEAKASEPVKEIDRLEKALEQKVELENLLKENSKKLKKTTKLHGQYKVLSKGFKDVKAYVFQSLLADLSNKSTTIAQSFYEIPVSIEFTNESEDGGLSKIATNVTLDGEEMSLGLLSGGQSRRVQLAVDLALAKIVANRSDKPISFRAFDEPFQHLSETSMQKVINFMRDLPGTTILIEHNSVAKSIVDQVFSVELRDGVTTHAS